MQTINNILMWLFKFLNIQSGLVGETPVGVSSLSSLPLRRIEILEVLLGGIEIGEHTPLAVWEKSGRRVAGVCGSVVNHHV